MCVCVYIFVHEYKLYIFIHVSICGWHALGLEKMCTWLAGVYGGVQESHCIVSGGWLNYIMLIDAR